MKVCVLSIAFAMCLCVIDAKPEPKVVTKREKDNSIIIVISGDRPDEDRAARHHGDAEHGDRDHEDRSEEDHEGKHGYRHRADGEHAEEDRGDAEHEYDDRGNSDAPKHKLSRSHNHEDSDEADGGVTNRRCCCLRCE